MRIDLCILGKAFLFKLVDKIEYRLGYIFFFGDNYRVFFWV